MNEEKQGHHVPRFREVDQIVFWQRDTVGVLFDYQLKYFDVTWQTHDCLGNSWWPLCDSIMACCQLYQCQGNNDTLKEQSYNWDILMLWAVFHWGFITVTSWRAGWRLKSPASRRFAQPFVQAQIKENIKTQGHWPLWGEFTGDR